MEPPKKSGPPRRAGPGGPKRPSRPGSRGSEGRGERADSRPERSEARGDRPARGQRTERAAPAEGRGDRPARGTFGQAQRSDRGQRTERAPGEGRGDRTEGRGERPARGAFGQAQRSDRGGRADRNAPGEGRDARGDRPARGAPGLRTARDADDRRPARGASGERPARTGERPARTGDRFGKPGPDSRGPVKSYPPRRPGTKKPAAPHAANPHPARANAVDEGKGEPQRIAKLLARAGIASRREIERMIEEGRISRDGVAIETPATLLSSLHGITVDGVAVAAPAPTRLFLFHKPTGYLTTERDPAGRPTIYDRLPHDLPRLMPIGRLDMNTEGLLLLTTDGEFKRQMELPATGVPRTYRARAFGEVSQQQLEDLFDGLEIDGIRYGPIEANLERRTGRNQWIEMTLTEGKNREVRRVLEHLDLKVNRLIRTSYGPFQLGELATGAVEEVRQHDLLAFRGSLKASK